MSRYKVADHYAWTGGSAPAKPSQTPRPVIAYTRTEFRRQVNDWRSYWHDFPSRDVFRTFYRRARHDAHATFRQ